MRGRIGGAVSSSEASAQRLKAHGIPVLDLNATGELDLYVDGADEATRGFASHQGRRRRADPREDRCGRIPPLRLHRRRPEAGRAARPLPAAGRSHPDGARSRGAAADCGSAASRRWREGSGDRQRQSHPRRPRARRSPTPSRSRPRSTRSRASSRSGCLRADPADVLLVGTADGVVTLTRAT